MQALAGKDHATLHSPRGMTGVCCFAKVICKWRSRTRKGSCQSCCSTVRHSTPFDATFLLQSVEKRGNVGPSCSQLEIGVWSWVCRPCRGQTCSAVSARSWLGQITCFPSGCAGRPGTKSIKSSPRQASDSAMARCRSRVSFEAETRPRFATGRKVAARREHGNAHGRSDKRIAKSHWQTIFVRFAACIGIREVAENGTTQGTDNPAWLQDAARASSAGRNSSAKSILLLVPAPLPQKSRHPGADLDMFRSRSRNARNDD